MGIMVMVDAPRTAMLRTATTTAYQLLRELIRPFIRYVLGNRRPNGDSSCSLTIELLVFRRFGRFGDGNRLRPLVHQVVGRV